MENEISRRGFLGGLAAVAGAAALPAVAAEERAKAATANAAPAKGLAAYHFESYIWIRIDSRPFTCYRAGASQKYPYFYPVLGAASGAPLTDEAGDPYPHHRSLFLGCDKVNGANYWQEGLDRGQIVSSGPKLIEQGSARVVIADRCEWRLPGKPAVIEDSRRFVIAAPSPTVRLIDADVTLTAREDVTVAKTNHSFFSIRAARDLTPAGGGELLNANGRSGEKQTFAEKAAWCAFGGRRGDAREAIVLMDHPANPWSPCPWFTRDYGFASPTPFYWMENGWTLAAGRSVRLRYRVAAMAGATDAATIGALYNDFTATGGVPASVPAGR
jgi:hypothetical protein